MEGRRSQLVPDHAATRVVRKALFQSDLNDEPGSSTHAFALDTQSGTRFELDRSSSSDQIRSSLMSREKTLSLSSA